MSESDDMIFEFDTLKANGAVALKRNNAISREGKAHRRLRMNWMPVP